MDYWCATCRHRNQNQYLLHVIGPNTDSFAEDWMVGTQDPYPFWSALATVVWRVSGTVGIRAAAFATSLVALTAVWLLVKRLRPGGPRVRLCALRAPALRTIAKRRETGHEHPPQSAESCHWATQRLLSIMDLSCIYLDD